jgi:hypothetical protein
MLSVMAASTGAHAGSAGISLLLADYILAQTKADKLQTQADNATYATPLRDSLSSYAVCRAQVSSAKVPAMYLLEHNIAKHDMHSIQRLDNNVVICSAPAPIKGVQQKWTSMHAMSREV